MYIDVSTVNIWIPQFWSSVFKWSKHSKFRLFIWISNGVWKLDHLTLGHFLMIWIPN
jgi:hypothetical protein